MFRSWLKRVLAHVEARVTFSEGDLLRIELNYKGTVIFDRTIDVMPHEARSGISRPIGG